MDKVITPAGVSPKDKVFRVRIEERTVKNGIVMGKKTGFAEATTPEGYELLVSQLNSGELVATLGADMGNGLNQVILTERAAV
jgi:hypothetical protein